LRSFGRHASALCLTGARPLVDCCYPKRPSPILTVPVPRNGCLPAGGRMCKGVSRRPGTRARSASCPNGARGDGSIGPGAYSNLERKRTLRSVRAKYSNQDIPGVCGRLPLRERKASARCFCQTLMLREPGKGPWTVSSPRSSPQLRLRSSVKRDWVSVSSRPAVVLPFKKNQKGFESFGFFEKLHPHLPWLSPHDLSASAHRKLPG